MEHCWTAYLAKLAAARAKEWFENCVTKRLSNDGDAEDGLALLRESYDELRGRRDR